MKNRPSSKDIRDMLQDSSNVDVTYSSDFHIEEDLTSEDQINVSILQIDYYDKNPRRADNPQFSQIKESIRFSGLIQPLVITKRPNHKNFMIYKGGNTRLKALRELYEESGDNKFKFANCFYIPWSGMESEAILGHLQENEMRKSLCFFDRASGVKRAIEILKVELQKPNLSLRETHSLFVDKGYSISLSMLSDLNYAANFLERSMPYSLKQTLGRPQVQRIRHVDRVLKNVCSEFDISTENRDKIFHRTLNDYNELTWSLQFFLRSLEAALASFVGTSVHDIALRMAGYMHLNDITPLSKNPTTLQESFDDLKFISDQTILESQKQPTSKNAGHTNPSLEPSGALPFSVKNPSPARKTKSAETTSKRVKAKSSDKRSDAHLDITKLRRQSYSTARSLAKRFDFHVHPTTGKKIVTNTGDWGMGFLITDFPAPTSRVKSHRQIELRDSLWWILFELSDIEWAMETARPLTANLVGESELRHFIRSADPNTLFKYARKVMRRPYPLIGVFTMSIRLLDNSSWEDIKFLLNSYRSMHQIARDQNIHLFRIPKGGI